MESMRCAGKTVPKAVSQSFTKPNSIVFGFSEGRASSEWKSGKCLYRLSYEAELVAAGKLRASPSGGPYCEPKDCLPKICQTSLPKLSITYGYSISKRTLLLTSPLGLECLAQGLAAPAELRLRKL